MTLDKHAFKEHIRLRLKRRYGKDLSEATDHDIYDAVSAASMEYILDNWMATRKAFDAAPGAPITRSARPSAVTSPAASA